MVGAIDINCDLGESYGRFKIGNDDAVFPYLTSCNVACGFHGGDPQTMEQTILSAIDHNVVIGAHPSYPDLQGFGRRRLQMDGGELKAAIKYQVGALKAMCESQGTSVRYVKPHGALYNACFSNPAETTAVLEAIEEIDQNLILMGLAGSLMEEVSVQLGRPFIAEAFADRRYTAEGFLQSRSEVGSVISTADDAVQQVLDIVMKNQVTSYDGAILDVKAQSVCIHGDNPAALQILQALDQAFAEKGIEKKSFIS